MNWRLSWECSRSTLMVRSKLQGMSDHTCHSPSEIQLDGYSVAYFNCITTPEAPYCGTVIKGAAHMRFINIVDIYTSTKPVWVPTLTVVHFECGDVIEIWDGIIFDFYARLSRYPITCWTIKLKDTVNMLHPSNLPWIQHVKLDSKVLSALLCGFRGGGTRPHVAVTISALWWHFNSKIREYKLQRSLSD